MLDRAQEPEGVLSCKRCLTFLNMQFQLVLVETECVLILCLLKRTYVLTNDPMFP